MLETVDIAPNPQPTTLLQVCGVCVQQVDVVGGAGSCRPTLGASRMGQPLGNPPRFPHPHE